MSAREIALVLVIVVLACLGGVSVLALLDARQFRDTRGMLLWAVLLAVVNVLGVFAALALLGKL